MATNLDNYDVSEDSTVLRDLMNQVLETVVSVYDSYNVPLPTKRYWTIGTPVADCEQAVVTFVQLYLGSPGDQASQPQRCSGPKSAVLTVSIFREIQMIDRDGNPLPVDKHMRNVQIALVDTWILMDALQVFDKSYDGGRGIGVIATINAGEPQGNYYVTNLQLTLGVV